MSRTKKILTISTVVVLALSLVLVGCRSSRSNSEYKLLQDGKLIIGSDCDYPPFIYMEGSQVAGFEYELMQAVGEKLNLEIVYLSPQNFDTLIASVAAGTRMDIGVSSFTITDDRKKQVDFTIPYFDSNQAVVTMKSSNYSKLSDLEGKVVGAQSGTTGADWALENIPGITLKTFNNTSECVAALVSGAIEAAIYDEPVASEHVTSTYKECEIMLSVATGEQYGIAVGKDKPELLAAISQALKDIKADGTFDRIFKKYFPDLTPPSIR